MKLLRQFLNLFRRPKLNAEMAEEMRLHVELQTERNVAAGMSADEARYAALRQFGNVASIQERVRDVRSAASLEPVLKDIRFAGRTLRRAPGFAGTAVAVLTFGVAASTVIFSLVHGLLWAPLQYRAPGELVQIRAVHPRSQTTDLAPGTFTDLAGSRSFATLAAHYYYYVNLTGTAEPALVNSAEVTRDYFRLFGVAPLLGHLWTEDAANPGATPVVVLSHELWRSHYQGRQSIIGEQIILDEVPHTVIAVMPPSFREPYETVRMWRPMRPGADNLAARDWRYWTVFGRLAPGATLAKANAEVKAIGQRLAAAFPGDYAELTLEVSDLREVMLHNHRAGLLLLLAGVACLMAITIINLTGLTLVRAEVRSGELAVRQSLGASRLQVVRLLLAEASLLALAGGGMGLALAQAGISLLVRMLPAGWLPRLAEVELSEPGLAVGVVLALCAGLAAGLVPAASVLRQEYAAALRASQRNIAGSASRRLRVGLVVTEIAFTLMLLTAAGLFGRSLAGLTQRSSGVDGPRVLTATVSHSAKRYDSPQKSWDYFVRAEQALAALPGVERIGLTQTAPFRWGMPVSYYPDHVGTTGANEFPPAFTDSVSVGYFSTVGITLLRGRLFTAADDHRQPPMLILSQEAARRYFGDKDPVGRELVTAPNWRFQVVGVVSDVRRAGLAADVPLQVYRPMAQRTPSFATIMVRSQLSPSALTASVQATLRQIDPATPITEIVPLDDLIARSIAQPRLHTVVFGLFAFAALFLAAIGLYGVIACSVARRTREFAIRLALGAPPADLQEQVLKEGLGLVALGGILGLMGSAGLSRLVRHLVFDVSALDPAIFLGALLVVGVIALLACFLPARRAAKVDPVIALRAE